MNKQKGYFLVESMVAMTLLVIGFLGILALLSNSIALNRVVSDQFIANYLAMEGVEIVKNIINSNAIQGKPWNENINNGSFEVDYASSQVESDQKRRLLFDSTNGRYGYQSGTQTAFTRTIDIEFIGSDEVRVNSLVKWSGRGGSFEINLENHFFNWRP